MGSLLYKSTCLQSHVFFRPGHTRTLNSVTTVLIFPEGPEGLEHMFALTCGKRALLGGVPSYAKLDCKTTLVNARELLALVHFPYLQKTRGLLLCWIARSLPVASHGLNELDILGVQDSCEQQESLPTGSEVHQPPPEKKKPNDGRIHEHACLDDLSTISS